MRVLVNEGDSYPSSTLGVPDTYLFNFLLPLDLRCWWKDGGVWAGHTPAIVDIVRTGIY